MNCCLSDQPLGNSSVFQIRTTSGLLPKLSFSQSHLVHTAAGKFAAHATIIACASGTGVSSMRWMMSGELFEC